MKKPSVITRAVVAVAALCACSGSGSVATETAGNFVYNQTYTGPGTIQRSSGGYASGVVQPTTVTVTFSQLGSVFRGALVSTATSGQFADSGDVVGRVTSSGGEFTFIQMNCQGTLHGSFVNDNGILTGAAAGRDCEAGPPASGDNVRITFTNLARP